MLEAMPSKKISRQKKEEVESDLILFGLVLVLLLSSITLWHVSYKYKNQAATSGVTKTTVDAVAIQRADLNQDGVIDEKDAKLIKKAFLKNDAKSLQADLNRDDKVDAKDFAFFNQILNSEKEATNVTN